jgi:flavin-binding protein dodecin
MPKQRSMVTDITQGVIKIIEVIGVSPKSWEDAVGRAVAKATETIDDITGVEVKSFTARVEEGKVVGYKANCKIAFAVH